VGIGEVMDRENVNSWQHSGIKTGAKLPTVASLVHVQWSFFATNMHPNNICETNKKETLLRKDTRMPRYARRCVRGGARACVRVNLFAYGSGRGRCASFRVSFRVYVGGWGGVRVLVRAWGGVGCKAAGTFGRGRVGWFLHIHREHKGISCLPLPQPQGSLPQPLYHEPKGISCFPSPRTQGCLPSPRAVYLFLGWLVISLLVTLLLGNWLFSFGGWVLMGGGCFFW
jgi:hypothetical protein